LLAGGRYPELPAFWGGYPEPRRGTSEGRYRNSGDI